MGLSITIGSGKGGVGKTTVTANLGVALAQFGKDVLLLDSDIEVANLEMHLGLEGMRTTLQNVLSGEAPISEAIYKGPAGVKIIPAGVSLDGLRKADPDKLEEILEEVLELTEILIIDAPPGLGKSTISALAAGQELLLVVNPDIASMSDALKTKIVSKKLGSHILGAIMNKMGDKHTDLTIQEVETILECRILGTIPKNLEVRKSSAVGQPIVLSLPESPVAIAFKKVAADLIGEEYTPPKSSKSVFKGGLFGKR